ncbi:MULTISPECIES: hypothetical protein [Bhargavaea]|uniref:Myb-like domain-containing protein n=1 Tax=Bhargavaea changchunensis TaxID=2134037 RepID=A0ABW2NEM0_9BACL|nr:hypothetical protein [Bhargavaea sp. CC-171006]
MQVEHKDWAAIESRQDRYRPNQRFSKEDLAAARLHGMNYAQLYYRVAVLGWTVEQAIRTPNGANRWTAEEDDLLRQLLQRKYKSTQIKRRFPNRTHAAIAARCTIIRKQLREEGLLR